MERDRNRLLALESDPRLGPSLFLYRWREPTITLGYAQRPERVLDLEAVRAAAVPVERRPTGGRAILHTGDWTYAAVVPIDDPGNGGALGRSLSRLAQVVAEALAAFGIECGVAPEKPARGSGPGTSDDACFTMTAGYELTIDERKLAGSAQRRLARALLTQGTILVGPGTERLADFLVGDAAEKERARARLAGAAISLEEASGAKPDFASFARALEETWRRTATRAPARLP